MKRSQNADGGFMYMIQGGESAMPRSAAAVAALYSAGIYKGPEITKGLDYLMQFLPSEAASRHESYYFYGQYYATQAMWQAGGRALEPLVPGGARRPHRPAAQRRLLADARGKRMRHGNGVRRVANAEQLFADFSTIRSGEVASGQWIEMFSPAVYGRCIGRCLGCRRPVRELPNA